MLSKESRTNITESKLSIIKKETTSLKDDLHFFSGTNGEVYFDKKKFSRFVKAYSGFNEETGSIPARMLYSRSRGEIATQGPLATLTFTTGNSGVLIPLTGLQFWMGDKTYISPKFGFGEGGWSPGLSIVSHFESEDVVNKEDVKQAMIMSETIFLEALKEIYIQALLSIVKMHYKHNIKADNVEQRNSNIKRMHISKAADFIISLMDERKIKEFSLPKTNTTYYSICDNVFKSFVSTVGLARKYESEEMKTEIRRMCSIFVDCEVCEDESSYDLNKAIDAFFMDCLMFQKDIAISDMYSAYYYRYKYQNESTDFLITDPLKSYIKQFDYQPITEPETIIAEYESKRMEQDKLYGCESVGKDFAPTFLGGKALKSEKRLCEAYPTIHNFMPWAKEGMEFLPRNLNDCISENTLKYIENRNTLPKQYNITKRIMEDQKNGIGYEPDVTTSSVYEAIYNYTKTSEGEETKPKKDYYLSDSFFIGTVFCEIQVKVYNNHIEMKIVPKVIYAQHESAKPTFKEKKYGLDVVPSFNKGVSIVNTNMLGPLFMDEEGETRKRKRED